MTPRSRLRLEPSGALLIYLLVLGGFWYAGVSQNNSMAYLLFFFLISLGGVSVLIGCRTVSRAEVRLAGMQFEGFADEGGEIRLAIGNPSRQPLVGLRVACECESLQDRRAMVATAEIPRLAPEEQGVVRVPTRLTRGIHRIRGVVASSIYPLGLFRWTKWMPTDGTVVVYPAREGEAPLPLLAMPAREGHAAVRSGGDDFRGWRVYQEGDSSRHIDWKAVARGQGWLVKEFEGESGGIADLRWATVPGNDCEARLSQLAMWLDLCDRQGWAFRLELEGGQPVEGAGGEEKREALRRLAAWPGESPL